MYLWTQWYYCIVNFNFILNRSETSLHTSESLCLMLHLEAPRRQRTCCSQSKYGIPCARHSAWTWGMVNNYLLNEPLREWRKEGGTEDYQYKLYSTHADKGTSNGSIFLWEESVILIGSFVVFFPGYFSVFHNI